jgi:hypothetical protein
MPSKIDAAIFAGRYMYDCGGRIPHRPKMSSRTKNSVSGVTSPQRYDEPEFNAVKVFFKLAFFDAGLFVKPLPNLLYREFDNLIYPSATYNRTDRIGRINEETRVSIDCFNKAPAQLYRLAPFHNLIGILRLDTDQDVVFDCSALIHKADSESGPM